MAGINVLSDTLKVGSKLEKTPTPKGKDVADSPEKAAAAFSAMLSGSMNQNVDPKGQNSSKAGQDLEEKQSTEDPVQSAQIPNGLGSMLGYGNFALPFLTQMLQSDLPAGKEANSGNVVGQGVENSSTVNSSLSNTSVVSGNNLELAMLNLLSLASDEVSAQSGMTVVKPQGDNPGTAELDKYIQVISELLEKLSGEITSPKDTLVSSASPGTKDLSQDIVKIVQGWLMASDDGAIDGQASSGQKGIQPLVDVLTTGSGKDNLALNAKVSSLLSALNPQLNQSVDGAKETTVLTKVKGMVNQELIKEEGIKSSEPSEANVQNESFGSVANIVAVNVAEAKTATSPVVEQIATAFREQVVNGSQILKNLEIQLHPAELGKIQIAMRWENGQVHLQVQASEAATGQLLQNQFSNLRQTLMNQGVNCGTLQMGQGGEQQKNPHGDESQRMLNQNTQPNEDENLIPVINQLSLGQDGINRINVTA